MSTQKQTRNLIIGANSFLSKAITVLLLGNNEHVEGIYHHQQDQLFEGLTYYPSHELTSLKDNYENVFIISAFIPKSLEADTNKKLFQTNVLLTETIVQQFPSAKIIYASSVSVYGDQNQTLNESSPLALPNTYGISKLWGEQVVRTAKRHAVLRISSMYGIGMSLSTFLPRVIEQALSKKEITVWGDGARQQNYVAVQDVAAYMIAAAQSKENGTYLAVGPQSYSNLEIAQLIQKFVPSSLVFFGNDSSASYHYNNDRTVQQLGNRLHQPFEQAIEELIQWIKKRS